MWSGSKMLIAGLNVTLGLVLWGASASAQIQTACQLKVTELDALLEAVGSGSTYDTAKLARDWGASACEEGRDADAMRDLAAAENVLQSAIDNAATRASRASAQQPTGGIARDTPAPKAQTCHARLEAIDARLAAIPADSAVYASVKVYRDAVIPYCKPGGTNQAFDWLLDSAERELDAAEGNAAANTPPAQAQMPAPTQRPRTPSPGSPFERLRQQRRDADPRLAQEMPENATLPSQALATGDPTQTTQNYLNALGYGAGNADGEMDSTLAVAISQFQAEMGIDVTGEVSPQLIDILAAEVDKGARAGREQIEKQTR